MAKLDAEKKETEKKDRDELFKESIARKSTRSPKNRTLSEKYNILTLFQFSIGGSVIVYTFIFFPSIGKLFDFADQMNDYTIVLTSIISYILVFFNSICVILIVNFLFNLDNDKSDR